MIVVKTKAIRKLALVGIRAGAITILFWCICDPLFDEESPALMLHEPRHSVQQIVCALICTPLFMGAGFGLHVWWLWALSPVFGTLVWFWLYLVGLPIGLPWWFNPWREWMERDAYLVEGYHAAQLPTILRRSPYFLTWQVFS
jgi:hypothetical protein